jgi:hypothetical protein
MTAAEKIRIALPSKVVAVVRRNGRTDPMNPPGEMGELTP